MASNHFTWKLINLILFINTFLIYSQLFCFKMVSGKNLKNYRNDVWKLLTDFRLPREAYPLAYVILQLTDGNYEVAAKLILEGKYTLLKY